jgi:hypothetical protein
MRLYPILQLAVFDCCPFTRTSRRRSKDAGIQGKFHLSRHCFLVRPGTSAAIATQSLPPCSCTASFSLTSSTDAHLPVRPLARSMLQSKASSHLCRHCDLVRPGTSAEIATQSLSPCVCTPSFSLLSSTAVHLPVRPLVRSMLGSKASCHLCRHWVFVRHGTRAAITPQSLPPHVRTASLSLLSSTADHLPLRPLARAMMGSKKSYHLLQHCLFDRSGTSTATATQSLSPYV